MCYGSCYFPNIWGSWEYSGLNGRRFGDALQKQG